MELFDICLITASNPTQAETFRECLRRRLDHGLYPREIDFRVVHDPEAGRIGSGGGTLCALADLVGERDDREAYFADKRILIIHAGGESRRLPCYAPEGKLFTPLPLPSSSILPPVMLDLHLTLFLRYPWNAGEVVVISGDVVVDCDLDAVPVDRGDLCGFAKPASVEQGSQHGVFVFDANQRHVVDFLQKRSAEDLRRDALLEGTDQCALDMGIVAFSPRAANALLAAGDAAQANGVRLTDALRDGKAAIDLYLEILTAGLHGLSVEDYVGRVGEASSLDVDGLRQLHAAFRDVDMTAIVARRAVFLHFGTVRELPASCRELTLRALRPFYLHADTPELESPGAESCIRNGCIDVVIPEQAGPHVYLENCRATSTAELDGDNMLVGLRDTTLTRPVRRGICIDQRRGDRGSIALVYSDGDVWGRQPSANRILYCGVPLDMWLEERGFTMADAWHENEPFELLSARLFCPNMPADLWSGYWNAEDVTPAWRDFFRRADRQSIRSVNDADSVAVRERERREVRAALLGRRVRQGRGWNSMSEADFLAIFDDADADTLAGLRGVYDKTDDRLLRLYRGRLLNALLARRSPDSAVETPTVDMIVGAVRSEPLRRGVKDDQIVSARSPVRLDLAGGWSDTPPYTLRAGGEVVNVAVDLNGQPPIQVFCRPTPDVYSVRLHSIDLGLAETADEFDDLAAYRDPTSPFALPKAALCLLGLTPEDSGAATLSDVLKRIGHGLEMTLLCAVPKGSGLGTSSILGATILAAAQRFFGQRHQNDRLFRQVLQMEQMLTTGGGWQDQIGGIVGGVKYSESRPGLKPAMVVHQLDPHLFQERLRWSQFTLFYTGITRLAKNILQEVVDQCNAMTPSYLFTLDQVRHLGLDAKRAIELRDMSFLARVVQQTWEAKQRIHPSATNDEVDALLADTRELYTGATLAGAGGGGYLLFISGSPAQADALRERLRDRHENERARIVDFSLNLDGLQVSAS